VLGISISQAQIARASQLTPAGLPCRFAVMDALASISPMVSSMRSGVWRPDRTWPTSSATPMSCCAVLAPEGLLAVADLEPARSKQRRADEPRALGGCVSWLDQWAHPSSPASSLSGTTWPAAPRQWSQRDHRRLDQGHLASWIDSIMEGIRRPGAVLGLGPMAVLAGLPRNPDPAVEMDLGFPQRPDAVRCVPLRKPTT